ncbi:MAG: hypothetical protein NE334_15680, partial [Lentisphaeraceae bacterium]|nr:hypothetical protein [Lentisphaeraceae bacterium]
PHFFANIFMENPPDPLEDRELERIKLTALTADVYSFITLLYSNRQIVEYFPAKLATDLWTIECRVNY